MDGVSASKDDTVGAFVGAELRGKTKVVNSGGKAYVALMVNVRGASNTVTLKVHVAGANVVLPATSGGAASLLVSTAGTVGSGTSPALIEASTHSGGSGGGGVTPPIKPVITSVTASWGASLNGTDINSDGIVTVVTSDAENGQTVTVTFNGKAYNGTVAGDSTEMTVGASDLQGLTDGSSYYLVANVSDAAGNAATEFNGIPFMVDTTAPSITSVTASWGTSLNGTDINSDGTVTVVTSGAENGQTVTVTFNGMTLRGPVGGDPTPFTVRVPSLQGLTDGSSYTLAANVSDAVGNAATEFDGIPFKVDTTAPSITSVTVSWGTTLNGTDINSDGTVTVVTSGAENGQTVTVTLNGKSYNGTVAGDSTEVTVGASDLQGLTDGSSYTLAANVSDAAGNAAESVSRTVVVDKKTVVQTLDLKKGWNLVSLYLEADDMAPSTLFEPIKSSLIIIKDTTSLYDPDIPEFLNTLKKMRQDKGYWVKVKEDKLLTIKGSMSKEVTVNLRSGWNLIGYPVIEPIAPSEIFKSIINDVEVLKTPFESYIPTLPAFLNTLIQMEAGGGYWVKMKKAAVLKFGDGDN